LGNNGRLNETNGRTRGRDEDVVKDPTHFAIERSATLADTIAFIDANGEGIALVIEDERLVATITDGDIRRALMNGVGLDGIVDELIDKGKTPPHDTGPLVAPASTNEAEQLSLMNRHGLRHLPLVDDEGRVVELILLRELTSEVELGLKALVMAGGYGTRIAPLTHTTPKPMLQVGDKPLIERTIETLGKAGIKQVNVAVHYLPDQIRSHLGTGERLGVELSYVAEDEPLGTAGALRLIDVGPDPILVINGDIVTTLDFRAMLDYHRQHDAEMTVAVRRYDFTVPFGVVATAGTTIERLEEKPRLDFLVNAGIYLLEPSVVRRIPPGATRFDMTDLVSLLLEEDATVVAFLVTEYWMDIGELSDYERAQSDHRKGKIGG
jgi:dTDP-glucose pyrophosphorylase/CBS domain-containing protein